MALQQQPSNSPLPIPLRPAFNIATFLADGCVASIAVFTRCGTGTRGMGMAGFCAMVGIPIYAGLAKAPDMLAYWHLWFAMAIYRRITADPAEHTQYRGRPWMFTWCTKSEMSARLFEAAAMPVIGGIVSAFREDIGHYITVVGTFSFAYRYILDARTEAHHDVLRQSNTPPLDINELVSFYVSRRRLDVRAAYSSCPRTACR